MTYLFLVSGIQGGVPMLPICLDLGATVDFGDSLSPAAVGVDGCFLLALCSRGVDFNSSMPGCVCPKVKDMGPFLDSSE